MFYVAPNQSEVRLFFGCNSTKLPRELQRNTIGCYAENERSSVVALYADDKNVSLVSKNCREEVVIARVENVVKGGIEESLRNGFRLNWIASDCNECNRTGGRCGFDRVAYTFKCYCTDRVHAARCDTGYYSYLYAKCFAATIWKKVCKEDPLSPIAGNALRTKFLQHGGARDPAVILNDLVPDDIYRSYNGGIIPDISSLCEEMELMEENQKKVHLL